MRAAAPGFRRLCGEFLPEGGREAGGRVGRQAEQAGICAGPGAGSGWTCFKAADPARLGILPHRRRWPVHQRLTSNNEDMQEFQP